MVSAMCMRTASTSSTFILTTSPALAAVYGALCMPGAGYDIDEWCRGEHAKESSMTVISNNRRMMHMGHSLVVLSGLESVTRDRPMALAEAKDLGISDESA
jgi:hypothetical protein